MKLAVVFWFYERFESCASRLRTFREFNPELQVFGLYGGPLDAVAHAKGVVGPWVDDMYVFPEPKDAQWKWNHGDRMIARWYEERGHALSWDTVFVMQWDMLVLTSLEDLFKGLQPAQIVLPGFRPLDEVREWWPWVNGSDPLKQAATDAFGDYLARVFGEQAELFACLFVFACFPRNFLERYAAEGAGVVGWHELKLASLAKAFGVPVYSADSTPVWWAANPATQRAARHERVLNAVGQEVRLSVILSQWAKRDGARLFHPVFRDVPHWMLRLAERFRR